LEVSEDLTARYSQQAKDVDMELLVKGLDLLAQCDSQYKSSKEPRLLVELMLIQMCRINRSAAASVEGGNGAHSAEKKSPDVSAAPENAVPIAQKAVENIASEPEGPRASNDSQNKPDPAPSTPGPDRTAYVPKRRLAGQVSIKETTAAAAVEAAPVVLQDEDGSGMPNSSKVVNQALLLKVWRDYAQKQKRNGRDSLHATLMANEPLASGPGKISFDIVNTVQENYMRDEKPELLGHLRRALGDPGLDLQVNKTEIAVKPRYTVMDKFKLMAEKNPALLTLRDAVDLDLG
jgi:DNA polymerase-3 subunit gamma/tau